MAGIGDLVLTCTGKLSRNRYVGFELGKGKKIDAILKSMKEIAEGVTTTISSKKLSEREKIEMPICEQVYQILYQDKLFHGENHGDGIVLRIGDDLAFHGRCCHRTPHLKSG